MILDRVYELARPGLSNRNVKDVRIGHRGCLIAY